MRLTKMCALGMLVALMAMLTLVPIAAAGDIEGKVRVSTRGRAPLPWPTARNSK